jgi:predicted heme/steroid binding protein
MTQTRKEALIELRDNVKAGPEAFITQGTAAFDEILEQMWIEGAHHGSLDAAKALHEAVLPGWIYNIAPGFAHVIPPHDNGDQEAHTGLSETLARAWLLAILEALIAKAEGGE